MKLEGQHDFAVSRATLWQALVDPALLARVLPGCEPLEATGETTEEASGGSPIRYRAAMTVAIGPVKGRFAGTLELSDLIPPSSYRMKVDGSGQSGFLRGEGAVELHETAGGSRLVYQLDAQVGGRIASVGQRLVESSGRVLAKQGLEGLARELAARDEAPPASSPDEPPGAPVDSRPSSAPPSTARFAARFALGLWRELPVSWRYVGLGAVAGLLLTLLLLLLLDRFS